MRSNRLLSIVVVLAATAPFGCGVESDDNDADADADTSSVELQHWVGGHEWYVCGGGVHLRAWPSDAAPIPPGAGNGGFAPDKTAVHTYSDWDAQDGTLHWDPANVGSPVSQNGWIKRSRLILRTGGQCGDHG